MKIYCAKYALTDGILELDASKFGEHFMVAGIRGRPHYLWKSQWSETRDGAVAIAKTMQEKKVKSLRKQIARMTADIPRIEALKFE